MVGTKASAAHQPDLFKSWHLRTIKDRLEYVQSAIITANSTKPIPPPAILSDSKLRPTTAPITKREINIKTINANERII